MNGTPIAWPEKRDVLGVSVTPTTYEEATNVIVAAAKERQPAVVSCHAVHAVVTASCDRSLREKVNTFDMITPDGQPVRWALNLLHRAKLRDRVYGPDLTLALCKKAADEGVPIYLYGGRPEVVEKMRDNLMRRFPGLRIAGYESPPFRALTPEEDEQMVQRINGSGAGIVFIGLGCPKQDLFAYEHRDRIQAVQVCVGAAFDFHAGVLPQAPTWMQRRGLEWLYRLMREPRRLWRRYLVTNTIFLAKLFAAMCRPARRAT
jgi:exopolysaccharide biosynthesis WecB/TagA/CpsF family protein